MGKTPPLLRFIGLFDHADICSQLFIIEGSATVGLACVFAFVLPNSPASIRWLTDQEKAVVLHNFEQDQGQLDNSDEVTAGKGFSMAVQDPKTWLLMATLYCVSYTSPPAWCFVQVEIVQLTTGRYTPRPPSRIFSPPLSPRWATPETSPTPSRHPPTSSASS